MNSTGRQRILYKTLEFPPQLNSDLFAAFEAELKNSQEMTIEDDHFYLYFFPQEKGHYLVYFGRSITGYPRYLSEGFHFFDQENRLTREIKLPFDMDYLNWDLLKEGIAKSINFEIDEFRIVFKRIVDKQNRFRLELALEQFI